MTDNRSRARAWQSYLLRRHLESLFGGESVMIVVQHAPGLSALMRELCIWPQHISQAVNDRDLGLVDDGITRVVALRWFDSDHALLVDARITKTTHDLSGVRIHAVMVDVAIWIRRLMPAGRIASGANLHGVLYTVAKSFGLSVTCHPRYSARFLYAGPCDGITADVHGASRESVVFICGSFKPDHRTCELVWALDMTRYRAWFLRNVAVSLRPIISMSSGVGVKRSRCLALGFPLPGDRWIVTPCRALATSVRKLRCFAPKNTTPEKGHAVCHVPSLDVPYWWFLKLFARKVVTKEVDMNALPGPDTHAPAEPVYCSSCEEGPTLPRNVRLSSGEFILSQEDLRITGPRWTSLGFALIGRGSASEMRRSREATELASLMPASWNQMASWLEEIEPRRQTA